MRIREHVALGGGGANAARAAGGGSVCFASGGFHVVHAANNAFTGWKEYDLMIGLGWRGKDYGPRVFYDDAGHGSIVLPWAEVVAQLREAAG